MADEVDRDGQALRSATREDLRDSLSYALRYRDGKRMHNAEADSFMARIAAERLVDHLTRSGFVVLKKPPAPAPSTAQHLPARPPLKD